MKKIGLVLLLISLILSKFVVAHSGDSAQSNNKFQFSGYVDVIYAHSDVLEDVDFSNILADYEPYGFAINRAAFAVKGNIGENTYLKLDISSDSLKLRIRDLYINYKIHDMLQIKAGRYKVPGAYEMFSDDSFLSDTTMWFYDRSHASNMWLYNSYLGTDSRIVGLMAYGSFFNNLLTYYAFLGNPDGNAMFLPRQNRLSYSHYNNSFAGWGRIDIKPTQNIKLGTFIGDGKGRHIADSLLVKLITYGANLCIQSHGASFMYEFTRAKTHDRFRPHYAHGHVAMLSYKWKFVRPAYRLSMYMPNLGEVDEWGIKQYYSHGYSLNFTINPNLNVSLQYFERVEKNETKKDLYLNNLAVLSIRGRF